MRSLLVLLALSAGLIGGDAAAFDCSERAVIRTTRDDGTEIGIKIPSDRIEAAPAWSPGEGEPPLSIPQAIDSVLGWAAGEYTRYDSVAVWRIGLSRYTCGLSRGTERWYYVFDLTPMIDGNRVHGSGNFAAVLMNGEVIGPTELEPR